MKICTLCEYEIEESSDSCLKKGKCPVCGSEELVGTEDLFDVNKGINFICSKASNKDDRLQLIKTLLKGLSITKKTEIVQGNCFEGFTSMYDKHIILKEFC